MTQCEPVDGQRWTNGVDHYSDDGSFWGGGRESPHDLVSFVGLLPDSSQRAPVSRPAETENTTAVAGGVSEDPGRIIYELEKKLEAANAEIDRLRTELQQTQQWRAAATDAHSQVEAQRIDMQAEIESLTVRLQRAEMVAAEALQKWETTEQVCLRIITALAGVRS